MNKKFLITSIAMVVLIIVVATAIILRTFKKDKFPDDSTSIFSTEVTTGTATEDVGKEGKLYIDGEYVDDVMIFRRHAILPLRETLDALEWDITWESEDSVKISFSDKVYTFDIENRFLNTEDGGHMYVVAAGSRHTYYTKVNGEWLIDTTTIGVLLFYMGARMGTDINYDESTVYVNIDYNFREPK